MIIDPTRVSFVENDTSNETLIDELSADYKPAKTWSLYIDGVCTGWHLATYETPFRPGRPYSFVYENTEPDFETLADAQTALVNAFVETLPGTAARETARPRSSWRSGLKESQRQTRVRISSGRRGRIPGSNIGRPGPKPAV